MTPTQPPRGPITFGSLFSGIGGLDLGLERAGMVCRWQCEIDPYATRVLEKHWPHVKRYSDVRTITDAEPVGLICGGVPCQPWSVAGKQRGQDDARDLWPEFWRVCLLVRPRYVLMEEVPGFAVPGGLGRALTDLARAGFDAEWLHLSAADVGAPHLRKRLFLVAYAGHDRLRLAGEPQPESRRCREADARSNGEVETMADADGGRFAWSCADCGTSDARPDGRDHACGCSAHVADPLSNGREPRRTGDAKEVSRGRQPHRSDSCADNMADADLSRLAHGRSAGVATREEQLPHAATQRRGDAWWSSEPDVCGMDDGISERLDGGLTDASAGLDSSGRAINGNEASLREVWHNIASRAASSGRGSDEQLARELGDAVPELPHAMALGQREEGVAAASRFVHRVREACQAIGTVRDPSDSTHSAWLAASPQDQDRIILAACGRADWSFGEWLGVRRVSHGVTRRVDRLRCLGNAVVPQVAEAIGRMIVRAAQ